MSKTSIVIVGAGGATAALVQALDKSLDPAKHEVTIISATDYYRALPAALRTIITSEGKLEDRMCIPYDAVFAKTSKSTEPFKGRVGSFVFGTVVGVEEREGGEGGHVVLEDGKRIEWDYLVVATGSNWAGPLKWPTKKAEVSKYLDGWREKFASAKSVVLAGAGAVGCELAGEIKDFYPNTEVTLVQRDSLVLNKTYPDAFRQRVANELAARGVKVLTGDSVNDLSSNILDGTEGVVSGRTITTSKGTTVSAELIIPTGGRLGVNTSFISSSSSTAPTISKAVGSDGHLSVKQTLQLTTNPRVFACGDVVALNEQHTLMKSATHTGIVAANLLSLIQSKGQLKDYSKPLDMILITNGRTGGSAYFGTVFGFNLIFGSWFSAMIKSKGLLIGMARGALNQA